MMRRPLAPLALTLAALAAAGALGSAPSTPALAAPQADAPHGPRDEVERATEWPSPEDATGLADALVNLRRATGETQVQECVDAMVAHDAAGGPRLLLALSREKSEENRARFVRVLDRITTPAHTRLLAEEFDSKSDDVKLFAVRRVTELGDPGLRKRAEGLWAAEVAAEEAAEKKKGKRKEPTPVEVELRERIALFALATGSPASLSHVVERAGSRDWALWRAELTSAARAGSAANEGLAKDLLAAATPTASASVRAGALRLLAYAGTADLAERIRFHLDAKENHVKIAAINALRLLVDGDEPLEKLSTFDAIEMAAAWKSRDL